MGFDSQEREGERERQRGREEDVCIKNVCMREGEREGEREKPEADV